MCLSFENLVLNFAFLPCQQMKKYLRNGPFRHALPNHLIPGHLYLFVQNAFNPFFYDSVFLIYKEASYILQSLKLSFWCTVTL
ncbi:hypothetical protein L596_016254 [Steinernema carpocapsae]|uniref:Uncharacterized protein n=1 Tax=Steinernema carpocapsae TaxID=34508 RepID=A0A4V6A3C4_STECR|nr:hypothetical protein L596_016254 [Steinernema carpocapsae]